MIKRGAQETAAAKEEEEVKTVSVSAIGVASAPRRSIVVGAVVVVGGAAELSFAVVVKEAERMTIDAVFARERAFAVTFAFAAKGSSSFVDVSCYFCRCHCW